MRFIYSFLYCLILPFILMRLFWRARKNPHYKERWMERLGFYQKKLPECIWIHVVSMGEAMAGMPIIKKLQEAYPQIPLVITTMTPTGAAYIKTQLRDSMTHVYVPYDFPFAVKRFINNYHPKICIILETELWPNLLSACANKKIPVCLLNARLSEQSARGYQKIARLTHQMLQQITKIAAISESDAKRFIALGAKPAAVEVTGSIKFDIAYPAEIIPKSKLLRQLLGESRFIWIAASTHPGEEELILKAHQLLRSHCQDALLILVPRHADRAPAIKKLSEKFFTTVLRSEQSAVTNDTAVYLADTMGELLLLYASADVAFVGGSLVKQGGHNFIEPAVLSLPIITGPYLFNFTEISELFLKEKAMIKVNTSEELANQLIVLKHDPTLRQEMSKKAEFIIIKNRGVLVKQWEIINNLLS